MPDPFEVYVKGHDQRKQLGACPFSLRVLLALEEKNLTYSPHFIDVHNKPKWMNQKFGDDPTLPILKDVELDSYLIDSAVICDYLETKTDVHPLGKSADMPCPGKHLWEEFSNYMSNKEGSLDALKKELKEIEQTVDASDKNKAYFGGIDVNAWDMAIAPRLFIAREGCRHLKKYDFAEDFENIKAYIHRIIGRKSWRNSTSWDQDSIIEDLEEEFGSQGGVSKQT